MAARAPPPSPADLGFGRLFAAVHEAVVVADVESGRIVLWNPAAERMFGYSAADAIGMPPEVLVPDRLKPRHRAGFAHYRATGHGAFIDAGQPLEVPAVRKDGGERTVELTLSPIEDAPAGGRYVLALVRDVTDLKWEDTAARELPKTAYSEQAQMRVARAQARLTGAQAAAKRLRRLQSVTDISLARLAPNDLLRELLRRVQALLAADTAAVLVLEGENLIVRAAVGLEGEVEREVSVPLDTWFAGRIVSERRPVAIEDVDLAEVRPSPREKGVKSLLGAPLLVGGRLLGVVRVGTLARRRFTDDDARLLHFVAQRAARALEHARQFQAERQARAEAEALAAALSAERDRLQSVIAERDQVEEERAGLYAALAERENQLRDLVGRLIAAQEEERRRVAYNLHDGLAQTAAGAHLHLQAFARRYQPHLPAAREELDRALELAQQVVREARTVVGALRPTVLDDLGLGAALEAEVEELRKEGWRVEWEAALGPERLDPAVETALFRVAQEALHNARKHAGTNRARVLLRRTQRSVRLEVQDWGQGFDPAAVPAAGSGPGERVGLSAMRERCALLGGRCEVRSRPGAGTQIVAEVPLHGP